MMEGGRWDKVTVTLSHLPPYRYYSASDGIKMSKIYFLRFTTVYILIGIYNHNEIAQYYYASHAVTTNDK
jgi:hypothetical protein